MLNKFWLKPEWGWEGFNFPEKGPMRGQYKFCIAKKFCMFYFTVIDSEDLASDLLEMLVLINL